MTTNLTLPIEIGRRYVRRDGKVVTAEVCPADAIAPDNCVWNSGAINSKFSGACVGSSRLFDLIADAPEEPPERPVGGYVGYADHCPPTTLPLPNYTEQPTYAITDYADVLRGIAEGKEVEWRSEHTWKAASAPEALEWIADRLYRPDELRIKPDTITINGREVPAPVSEALKRRQPYWLATPLVASGATEYHWDDTTAEFRWLKHGLIHLTEEAARAHAEALLSFTRREA